MRMLGKIMKRARIVLAILGVGVLAHSCMAAFAIDSVGYPRTHGQFRQFQGRISIDFAHPDRSSVAFHVQSGSVDVGSRSFDDYLRSVAFLDSGRFPSIDFVSKAVAKVDDHT